MNDIQVRGWSEKTQKMYYELFSKDFTGEKIVHEQELNETIAIFQKVFILMLSTGFKDAQNKPIYDRDILVYEKLIRLRGNKTKVENHYWEVYMSPKGQWVAKRGEVIASLANMLQSPHFIAGNTYENKDLIK